MVHKSVKMILLCKTTTKQIDESYVAKSDNFLRDCLSVENVPYLPANYFLKINLNC
jgi:hypothetical protein